MITSFSIGNFKAFGPVQQIPLKPITLIFGPNSAGKSSVLHSLLFAHEAHRTGQLDIFKPQLGGQSVDLGGFRQFTHRSRSENRIALTFQIPTLKSQTSQTWNLERVSVTATYGVRGAEEKTGIESLRPMFETLREKAESFEDAVAYRRDWERLMAKAAETGDDPPALLSYEIAVGDQPLVRASRKGAGVKVDSIFLDHPALADYLENLLLSLSLATEVTSDNMALAREVIGDLAPELELEMGGLVPTTLKKPQRSETAENPLLMLKGASDDTREQLRMIVPYNLSKLFEAVHDEVSAFLSSLRYLGPLRSNPPRHLAFAEENASSMAEGSFAWTAVRDNADLRAKVNEWLGQDFLQTQYEIGVDNLISSALTAEALETAFEEALHEKVLEWDEARSRTGDSAADELYFNPYEAWDSKMVMTRLLREIVTRTAAGAVGELTLRDKRNQAYVSHRDIGIGISQVLPVLAYAYASKEEVIAIEQPEIHLHPALQSELTDVFIKSAFGEQKNTFILETHSEHLILRLLRRIRETRLNKLPPGAPRVTPDDVAILFVQPTATGSEVKELRVDEHGRLIDSWPGGFFEESFNELF